MYRALVTFFGKISMTKGQEKEITDKEIAKDLLHAGYIEEVKTTKSDDVDNSTSSDEMVVKKKNKRR